MMYIFVAALLMFSCVRQTSAHGTVIEPLPRGMLKGSNLIKWLPVFDSRAPRDFKSHFPAGDKSATPGAGLRSQMKTGKMNWTLFQPMNEGFNWRASVCGDDPKGPLSHLRGGEYYFGGRIVRTYRAGSIVNFRAVIATHHNGYLAFHLCNVDKCNGEISVGCFTKPGACVALERAYTSVCDQRKSKRCGPIDRSDRTRWYLPCDAPGHDRLGDGHTMRYKIPDNFTCEHCVLHSYWTAANSCNPPGVVDYFTGLDRPSHWPRCIGQGGARQGWTAVQKTCGGEKFSEEYYQCADVRVIRRFA